ncbi:MAG: hypothetical protein PHC28_10350, partial [Flavobacterium sp.]|uniref:DUF7507 domain-containing protein n=1 Tax=Flavobacterium sp. TaxID=239 RepID=UPI002634D67C
MKKFNLLKGSILYLLLTLFFSTQFVYSQNCTANAGGNVIVCGESTTLNGSVSGTLGVGTPTWSFVSGPVTPTISSPNNLTTAVTGMSVDGNYVYQLSYPCGTGISQSLITVTAHPRPASFTAGTDITGICATTGTVNLAGVIPPGFTGHWTATSLYNPSNGSANATLSDPDISNPVFSLINAANHDYDPAYKLTLIITSVDGVCSYTDDMIVKFCPNPQINLNSASFCVPSGSTSSWMDLSSAPFFNSNTTDSSGSTASGTAITLNVTSQPAGANMTFNNIDRQRIYFNGATIPGIYTFTMTITNCCGTFTTAPINFTINGTSPKSLIFQVPGHSAPEQLTLYSYGDSHGEVHCGIANTSTPELFYFNIDPADSPAVTTTVTSSGILPPGASIPTITVFGTGTMSRYASVDPGASGWKVGTYRFDVSVSDGSCGTSNAYYIHVSDNSRLPIQVPDTSICYPGAGVTSTSIQLPQVYKQVVNSSYFQDFSGWYNFTVISQPVGSLPVQFTPESGRDLTDLTTTISNLSLPGDYVIRITPFNGNGVGNFLEQEYACSGISQMYDDFTIHIDQQINANSGADQVFSCSSDVFLQGSTVGTGTGTWSLVSTPVGATTPVIINPNSLQSNVTGFDTIGTYEFMWTITSAHGVCTSSDNVSMSFSTLAPVAPAVGSVSQTCTALGSITINTPLPAAGITYSIDNGANFQSSNVFNNLAAGTYNVLYHSTSIGCNSYTTVVNITGPPVLPDTDGDGVSDACDLDDDNDGIFDIDEYAPCVTGVPIIYDADGTAAATSIDGQGVVTFTAGSGGTAVHGTATTTFVAGGALGTYPNYANGGNNIDATALGGASASLVTGGKTVLTFDKLVTMSEFNIRSIAAANVSLSYNEILTVKFYKNGTQVFFPGTLFTQGVGTIYQHPSYPYPYFDAVTSVAYPADVTSGLTSPLEANYRFAINNPIDEIVIEQYTGSKQYNVGFRVYGVCSGLKDTDGDLIPDDLDPDSDNDSCSDANEAYGTTTAQGTDGNMYYGNGNPPAVNADGTVIGATYPGTNANVLTVGVGSTINTAPTDQVIAVGGTTSFNAAASGGSGVTSYQWQESTDGGTIWTNITDGGIYSGATTSTLTLTGVTVGMDGYDYQVVVTETNFVCGKATSTSANLTVNSLITLIGVASTSCNYGNLDYTVIVGVDGTAPFTATGTGAPGTWSGNIWTSSPIPTGTNYNVDMQDINASNTLNVSGVAPICVDSCLVGTDTDGDGVSDLCDLDDDNDGILDTVECPANEVLFANLKPLYPAVIPATGLTVGDRIKKTGALVFGAQTYDMIIEMTSVQLGTGAITLQSGSLVLANCVPNTNPYAGMKVEFVPTGSAPTAVGTNPAYTPATIPEWTLLVGDVDGNGNANFGEVIGSSLAYYPTVASVGSRLSNLGITLDVSGFGGPGAGYVYHRPIQLDGTTIVPNDTTNSPAYAVQGTFVNYTTNNYVYGLTGSQSTPVGARAMYAEISNPSLCDDDGDGIPNSFDLDSDNDGCSDANEYYNSATADGGDGGVYGTGTPVINADGTVTAASYTGSYANVNIATGVQITTAPVNQTIVNGNSTTFSVVATATNTTVYTGTAPNTLPDYTHPTTVDVSSGLVYQWLENGIPLINTGIYSGTNTATLSISNVTGLNGNVYTVVITHPNRVCLEQISATLSTSENPAIVITKDGTLDMGADGVANVGDVINYVFTVLNTGNVTLTNVTVTDINATVTGGPIATLAVGATDSATFTATHILTQADIDAGYVYNLATATGTSPDGNPVTDDSTDPTPCTTCPVDPTCPDCTIVEIVLAPAIVITKDGTLDMGADGVANVGDVINYVFTVQNTGNVTLTNVTVTDINATVTGGPIATLAVGATDTATFTATHILTQADIDAGQVDNLATATGNDPDGNPVTDTSSDPTPCGTCTPIDPACTTCTIVEIAPTPAIVVTKDGTLNMGSDGVATVGDVINYVFTVQNTGNVTLTNVTVSDLNATVVGGPLASLAVGATDSATFTATHILTQADIDAGYVYNLATATGNDPSGNPVTDTSSDPTPCSTCPVDPTCLDCTITPTPQTPAIVITKDGTLDMGVDGIATVGDVINYVFTVQNTGNVTLTNVTVTDINATVTGGPIASLAVGATDSATFIATHVLTQADIDAGYVYNLATATGADPDGNPVTD